jgi:hypothetical protein
MDNTLYIIRGLPGSGKSTEAKRIMAEAPDKFKHYEADDFFTNPTTGEYVFNASKLHLAHSLCLQLTENTLMLGFNVIVSNTFSTLSEILPYTYIASKTRARLDVRQMNNTFQNIHNVPTATIEKMKARWENFPTCVQIPPIESILPNT